MHATNRRSTARPAARHPRAATPALRNLAVAAALAAASLGAHALTLGAIQVQSALGQPLAARIAVPQITAAESASLTFSMGTAAEYLAAGLVFDPALAGVQVTFVPAARGGPAHLQVAGTRPVNAPLLNLIISANWASGQVNRNYALFLDPPGGVAPAPTLPVAAAPAQPPITASQTTPAAQPAPASFTANAGRITTPSPASTTPLDQLGRVREISAPRHSLPPGFMTQASEQPAPRAANALHPEAARASRAPKRTESARARPAPTSTAPKTATAPATASAATADCVTVKPGDTAFGFVRSAVAGDVSLDQLLAALLSANPDAFVRGDVNRLRTGAELQLPTPAEATSRSSPEARAFLTAQARDFDAYRAKAAAHVTARGSEAATQSAAGTVHDVRADTKNATDAPSDQLSVSKGSGDAVKTTSESIQREITALNSRVAELQRNLADLQEIGTGTTAAKDQAASADTVAASAAAGSQNTQKQTVGAAPDASASTGSGTAPADATSPAPQAESTGASTAAAAPSTDAAAADSQTTPASTPAAAAVPVVDTQTAAPEASPAQEPAGGVLQRIPRNAWLILLLIAILLLYAFTKMRRRREVTATDQNDLFAPTPGFDLTTHAREAVAADSAHDTPATFAAAPTSAPSDAATPINAPTAVIPATAPHGAETLAPNPKAGSLEHIAQLGQDAAALARQGDATAFRKVSETLHGLTGGAGGSWAMVAALGRILAPAEPLYQEHVETALPSAVGSESGDGVVSVAEESAEIELPDTDESTSGPSDPAADDGSERAAWPADESAIALRLARAEDLRKQGDSEGARSILQAVIAQSSGDPRERAQRMLTKLDE